MLALMMEASLVTLMCGQGCGSFSWPYKPPASMIIVFPCLSPLPTPRLMWPGGVCSCLEGIYKEGQRLCVWAVGWDGER